MSSTLFEKLPPQLNNNKNNLSSDHTDVVYCVSWHEKNKWGEIEISSDFKVYPCCTLHAFHQLDKTFFDDYFDSLESDWNDISKHSLKDIILKYREHIKPENWKNKNTTPDCCKKACLIDKN
tara:strand:- start:47 stop:412 length:366 start_codon:yes stop_codon:yes gene_type:complete